MKILGINSAYHEPAAALVIDGKLVFFVEEERINRVKHGKPTLVSNPHILPEGAIQACLKHAGITLDEIDLIGFSFAESGRRQNIGVDRHLEAAAWGTEEGENAFHKALREVPARLEKLGSRPLKDRFRWIQHHIGHAGSAFFCSPYERALVLAVDGIGEFDSLLMGHGQGGSIHPLFTLPYPHSLGFLWEKICQYLGFSEYDACKVMGLSSYGDPKRFASVFSKLARIEPDGSFAVDLEFTRFRSRDVSTLETLFGKSRASKDPIEPHHHDVAAALQSFTEQALIAICRMGKNLTGADYLCLSGGVALNCVANARLERELGFKSIFVQPAANDAGTALGAALHLWHQEAGGRRVWTLEHAYWGGGYSDAQIETCIQARGLPFQRLENPASQTARIVADGKVVGWFQGRMEMGPRALGNRTLLADPRRSDMREMLNLKVKHRESFRPFAPSVLAEKAGEWFDLPGNSPSTDFMLLAYSTKSHKRSSIPAVIHVDGTSRIQTVRKATNPKYHDLISTFNDLTGVPMVLNTSFNDSEPIVMSPDDALNTFQKTGIDAVVLNNYLVKK